MSGSQYRPRLVRKDQLAHAQRVIQVHRAAQGRNYVANAARQYLNEPLVELHMTDDEAVLLASQGITVQGEWL